MMKIAQLFLIAAMTSGVAIADSETIPWTFDDFDDNCNVIDHASQVKSEDDVE